ncbi:MAG: hypothetical protein M1826_004791 [Phylliscum demangeonii]|nr:MAG: hypothetical protein M1826_004791 [Phylliscum demangeonii]
MLQARRLGTELVVGVHSDQAILEHKGPTVMTLEERTSAVNACRWATSSVPEAPYVTSLPWISHYGCYYVVHGDDVTSDSSGEDCYRFVKAAGRFIMVKRTPGISTTDLVGRMLLCTRQHFIKSLPNVLAGEEGHGTVDEKRQLGQAMLQKIRDFASDDSGHKPWCDVWSWAISRDGGEPFRQLVAGKRPRPGQQGVYVDGGFDLFSSGHIAFLRLVHEAEESAARARGWYTAEAKASRMELSGEDYGPVYVVAGLHDDDTINYWKGVNYPIMNIFERGLCVLQCRYVHSVVFSAPFITTPAYLTSLPYGVPNAIYHGPTALMSVHQDIYLVPKAMGLYREIGPHVYQEVNAEQIVQRILKSRALYEDRQRRKGVKDGIEADSKRKEDEVESGARKI